MKTIKRLRMKTRAACALEAALDAHCAERARTDIGRLVFNEDPNNSGAMSLRDFRADPTGRLLDGLGRDHSAPVDGRQAYGHRLPSGEASGQW